MGMGARSERVEKLRATVAARFAHLRVRRRPIDEPSDADRAWQMRVATRILVVSTTTMLVAACLIALPLALEVSGVAALVCAIAGLIVGGTGLVYNARSLRKFHSHP